MSDYQFDLKVVEHFFKHDYHDRGMLKWQGFYLSDHTTALKKQREKLNRETIVREQQKLNYIKIQLNLARVNHYRVIVQLNELNKESELVEMAGKVSFLDDETVSIAQNGTSSLEEIRNVKILK